MNVMQIGIIGVIGALLAVQMRGTKTEYGIYLSVAVSILLFGFILNRLETLVASIQEINQYLHIETTYLTTLLKMIGITYIGEFSSSLCKDSGCQTLAVQIELFCKLTILVLSIPVLQALLGTVQEFLS